MREFLEIISFCDDARQIGVLCVVHYPTIMKLFGSFSRVASISPFAEFVSDLDSVWNSEIESFMKGCPREHTKSVF